MTKCKPPIFGDSAVLKKGLWVTLVIALVLALLACSTVWLLNGSFQSFVYFQF